MPDKPRLTEAFAHVGKHGKFGLGSIPDSPDPRDYDYRRLAEAGRFREIPDSVSLAEFLPNKTWNQNGTRACTSFAANLLVSVARAKAGIPYVEPSFLATWYWSKRAQFGPTVARQNVGTSLREAVLSTRREGVAPSSVFPFDERRLEVEPGPEVVARAEKHSCLHFFRVDDFHKGADLEFLYRCLAEGWPIAISMPIYPSFKTEYKTGFVPYPTDEEENPDGWLAMTLCGYYLNGRSPYFKCRLSWGAWGGRHLYPSGKQVEPGMCRLPVEYVRDMAYDCWSVRYVEDGLIQGTGVRLDEVVRQN